MRIENIFRRLQCMDSKLLVRRFIACVIDWIILFGGAILLMFFSPGSNPEYFLYPSMKMFFSLGFLLGAIWILFMLFFKDCLFKRRSLGKLICGLKIVDVNTQEPASFKNLILRNVTYYIIQIEWIFVLVNKGRRLGDLLAKTQVIISRS